jgi:uncharacterized protein (TIGR02421 family)
LKQAACGVSALQAAILGEMMGKSQVVQGSAQADVGPISSEQPPLRLVQGPPIHPGNPPPADFLGPYPALIRGLSDRLVEAQKSIRILSALNWDFEIEEAFFAAGTRELPPIDADYYHRRPIPFDPEDKRAELRAIERDVRRQLGNYNPAGKIIVRTCEEFREVIDLLVNRGTPQFAVLAERLYGGSRDCFHAGNPTLAELARAMSSNLENLSLGNAAQKIEPRCGGAEAARELAGRLIAYFGDGMVRVRLADGLLADAVAGSDYIKLRGDAQFSARDLRLLEVHEGWVHLGTSLNGQAQPVCTFLFKGPPSATVTQEGLAVLTEILAFASHPGRVRRLALRVEAVSLAESGADFLDIYRFFLAQGHPARESYHQAVRVFRGSLPAGCGPFTKDLCYNKGLVLVYNLMRTAVSRGLVGRIPLLFCGKTTLDDLKTLALLADEGLLAPPRYVPPPFADVQALAAWLCYANFLRTLSPTRTEEDFGLLL